MVQHGDDCVLLPVVQESVEDVGVIAPPITDSVPAFVPGYTALTQHMGGKLLQVGQGECCASLKFVSVAGPPMLCSALRIRLGR